MNFGEQGICSSLFPIVFLLSSYLLEKIDLNFMRELQTKIEKQEEQDFRIANAILKQLFTPFQPITEKMPSKSAYDMRMSAFTNQSTHIYAIELKSRTQDLSKYKTLPITVRKLCNLMKARREGDKLIYMVLLNNEEYYIFDLDTIQVPLTSIDFWNIKKVQFDDASLQDETPTIFLPIDKAIINGKFTITNGSIRTKVKKPKEAT